MEASAERRERYEGEVRALTSIRNGTDVQEYTISGHAVEDTTDWIERQVNGQMAEDIKNRFRQEKELKADESDPVLITEKYWHGWISELTSDQSFTCVIKWGGHVHHFMSDWDTTSINVFMLWLEGKR